MYGNQTKKLKINLKKFLKMSHVPIKDYLGQYFGILRFGLYKQLRKGR